VLKHPMDSADAREVLRGLARNDVRVVRLADVEKVKRGLVFLEDQGVDDGIKVMVALH